MPEIGDQLRETRMRNRIDITEVEAATKIRAKYLRALENEEWDLLPGPTFVKTFLRTYADYLGLDARQLDEEYRSRYERPSGQELTPFGTNLGSRRSRPRRPVLRAVDGRDRSGVVLLVVVALPARQAGAATTTAGRRGRRDADARRRRATPAGGRRREEEEEAQAGAGQADGRAAADPSRRARSACASRTRRASR